MMIYEWLSFLNNLGELDCDVYFFFNFFIICKVWYLWLWVFGFFFWMWEEMLFFGVRGDVELEIV